MSRYLLVAHQTADSPELKARVLDIMHGDRQAEFVLLVPATPIGYLRELEESAGPSPIAQARRRALSARELLAQEGVFLAATRLGGPDPLEAIEHELRFETYQAVIICTFPAGLSRWLHMDLPAQVARRHPHLEVRHVVARRYLRPGEAPEIPASEAPPPPPAPAARPVRLDVGASEAALLQRVLTSYIAELRTEIRATDRRRVRADLKEEAAALSGLLSQLSGAEQAPRSSQSTSDVT
jgi:hypothetical protein